MNVKIREIPKENRPRERLINKGSESLSDEELLAILIKTGTKDLSAKDLANNLLKEIKNINNLNDITIEYLTKIKGIGKAKACEIMAMVELGKRINRNINNVNQIKIVNASNIYNYYKNTLGIKKQEHFYCVYLDTKNHIIKEKLLYVGTINQSLVHPREIFKEAYLSSASSFICLHNHPSRNPEPSDMDINLTKQLKEIGNLLGIKLIDHIIICENSYFSFIENGLVL